LVVSLFQFRGTLAKQFKIAVSLFMLQSDAEIPGSCDWCPNN
jgi:hypothetical protein